MYSYWVKMAYTGNSPPNESPDLHKLDPYLKLFLFNFCAKSGLVSLPLTCTSPSQPLPQVQNITCNSVMLPAEAFEMRICLLNLSMAKPR